MGSVKLVEESSIELRASKSSWHPNVGFTATTPLHDQSSPLNIDVKNEISLKIHVLQSIPQHYP